MFANQVLVARLFNVSDHLGIKVQTLIGDPTSARGLDRVPSRPLFRAEFKAEGTKRIPICSEQEWL
jgi:hypothetical protein